MVARASLCDCSAHAAFMTNLSRRVRCSPSRKKPAEKLCGIIAKQTLQIKFLRSKIHEATSEKKSGAGESESAMNVSTSGDHLDLFENSFFSQDPFLESATPMLDTYFHPHSDLANDTARIMWADAADSDQDEQQTRTLRLRGLPFSATRQDIKHFLGQFTRFIEADSCIQIFCNRDGRPSGLAEIEFVTPTAAQQCRQEKNMQKMIVYNCASSKNGQVQDRYIEIFLCPDRFAPRQIQDDTFKVQFPRLTMTCCENLADETILIEDCMLYLKSRRGYTSILSALGNAVSESSRQYVRATQLGLKHILLNYPEKFSITGDRGREWATLLQPWRITLDTALCSSDTTQCNHTSLWLDSFAVADSSQAVLSPSFLFVSEMPDMYSPCEPYY